MTALTGRLTLALLPMPSENAHAAAPWGGGGGQVRVVGGDWGADGARGSRDSARFSS